MAQIGTHHLARAHHQHLEVAERVLHVRVVRLPLEADALEDRVDPA
jgi:hypothetical protein